MSQNSLTGLHLACRDGDLEGVKARLTDAASLEVTAGESQGTPLHFACVGGNPDIVRLLLKYKANVHSRDFFLWVPLHASSRYGHEDVVAELLKANAEMDSKDRWEWTPLHHAAREGHTPVISLLLNAQADPEARTSELWTPLHLAARYGHLDACKSLVEQGAEIESSNNGRRTALNLASFGGHPEVAKYLLDQGADPNAMAESGTLPGDEFHESVSEEQKVQILDILNSSEESRKRTIQETERDPTWRPNGITSKDRVRDVELVEKLQVTNQDLERQLQEANKAVENLQSAVGELSSKLEQVKKQQVPGTSPKDVCEVCIIC